jgi:hypothetical protein
MAHLPFTAAQDEVNAPATRMRWHNYNERQMSLNSKSRVYFIPVSYKTNTNLQAGKSTIKPENCIHWVIHSYALNFSAV